MDGNGPWRDDRWAVGAAEFSRLLSNAGYSVTTVSPVELASARGAPDVLLAVPSLESLPFETFQAVFRQLDAGGSLMASGGEPFRAPLYATPDGKWLDAAAYQAILGMPPPQGALSPQHYETLSPFYKQYTNGAGFRVPIVRARSISAAPASEGRFRAIGDPMAPAATLFFTTYSYSFTGLDVNPGPLIVWLPSPQVADPLRGQIVTALHASRHRLNLLNAGPDQIVWLPGEDVTGNANLLYAGSAPVQAVLEWAISGATGAISQPSVPVNLTSGEVRSMPVDLGHLPNGDYTVTFRLMMGDEEVDRIDCPVRVLDPALTRLPDQKIRVDNGGFSPGGHHVFLQGVNYWPRYMGGLEPYRFYNNSWFQPQNYDPDLIEADLSQLAALHFNLVNIQYVDLREDWQKEARALIDFLERCRQHGIWVRIALRASVTNSAYTGTLNPDLRSYLEAAFLPGNDRVFAYELLWEPFIGTHDHGGQGGFINGIYQVNTGRMLLDADWRAWVNDQYGSLANAEQIWNYTAPRDDDGQLSNPLDDQIAEDGPWRIMVAAYRRFTDDYLGRNLGVFAREIRRTDPETLLTYRNWTTMTTEHNANTGYDIGTGAAHLDFFSPERYKPELGWPEGRAYGLVTAYSRYRTGGKPVQWTEFGFDIGLNNGTQPSRAAQSAVCDTIMRQVMDDGSNAASVWWWPGGLQTLDGTDFGIIDPDGSPRECALVLAQWGAAFAAAPPDLNTDPRTTIVVDCDADARGSYGLFLNYQDTYVRARQAGQFLVLADQGTGTDTATMPLIQAGNAPYTGTGPLKFANAEFGGIRIVCPGLDVTVENGSSIQVSPGAVCQVTLMLVNTAEAQWLPASAPTGGVSLHTNFGDVPLDVPLPSLQRIAMGPLTVTMGETPVSLTGRLGIQSVGDFGEALNLTLKMNSPQ